MMHELDVEVGIFVEDQLAIGRALVIERIVGDRRERRLELRQRFHRGGRPRILLAVERKAAVLAIDGHEALLEVAALDGGVRTLLAFEPERVDVLPRDAFHGRDRIGADALMRLRMPGAQAQIAGVHHHRTAAATALHRHHLATAGDDEVLGAGHDGGGRHVDAGDARPAEAIERDRAGTHVIAGIERGHASEIAALGRDLGAAAPEDVFDVSGVDAGALGQRAQHGGAELLRMDARQRALAGLADAARGPACVDDQCVSHGAFLWFLCWRHLSEVSGRSPALPRQTDQAARTQRNGRPSASRSNG